MDRSRSSAWEEGDLLLLIQNSVEEDVVLEYKSSPALQKRDREKDELSKDVSAFANSAGGIIVYGMVENSHVPTQLDQGYDPTDISKEWIEQVIQGNIRPRIQGIHINPVHLEQTHPDRVSYVVTIPQGTTAHQASNKRYYKRFNFESVPMEDHEIRDVMNRLKYPLVLPKFTRTHLDRDGQVHKYALQVTLRNEGQIRARDLKIVLSIPASLSRRVTGFKQDTIDMPDSGFGTLWFENSFSTSDRVIFPSDEWKIMDDSRHYFEYHVDTNRFDLNDSSHPFLTWKTYADDMPPQSGQVFLAQVPTE